MPWVGATVLNKTEKGYTTSFVFKDNKEFSNNPFTITLSRVDVKELATVKTQLKKLVARERKRRQDTVSDTADHSADANKILTFLNR